MTLTILTVNLFFRFVIELSPMIFSNPILAKTKLVQCAKGEVKFKDSMIPRRSIVEIKFGLRCFILLLLGC